jgi:rhodanese-related sulfurtransferase
MKKSIMMVIAIVCSMSFSMKVSAGRNSLPSMIILQNTPIFKVVSSKEFKTLMSKKGAQLIDVRTPKEYNDGHIGAAKNIDFYGSTFKSQMEKLDRNKPVLLYCHSGGRSGQALTMLKSMGFKEVYDLKGGWSSWPK